MNKRFQVQLTSQDKSPEQEELDEKSRQMGILEADYASKQLDYSTLAGEIGAFRNRYLLRVGALYAQLDAIRAEVSAQLAKISANDVVARQVAQEARRQADETAQDLYGSEQDDFITFQPSAELKQLYRQAAKLIHPDRAKNEEDRVLRDRLMAEINNAYASGDAAAISEITEKYHDRLTSDESDDVGTRLVRVIRLIFQTRNRIASLDQAIDDLRASEWYKLKIDVEEKEAQGEDPLGRLAATVQQKIVTEKTRLRELFSEANVDHGVATPSLLKGVRIDKAPRPIPPAKTDSDITQSDVYCCRTERGDLVRTQSEAVIANVLFNQGIDYRYEYPVEGHSRPGIRRPSFLIFDANQRPILWLHLGPLADAEQRARWASKRDWFGANGFVHNSNFFVTEDSKNGNIDSQFVENLAGLIKTRLMQ